MKILDIIIFITTWSIVVVLQNQAETRSNGYVLLVMGWGWCLSRIIQGVQTKSNEMWFSLCCFDKMKYTHIVLIWSNMSMSFTFKSNPLYLEQPVLLATKHFYWNNLLCQCLSNLVPVTFLSLSLVWGRVYKEWISISWSFQK